MPFQNDTIDGPYPPLQRDTNMSSEKKSDVDNETILMTLDQIGQTIDIMTNVVGRLRGYITEQIDNELTNDLDTRTEGKPLVHKESPTLH